MIMNGLGSLTQGDFCDLFISHPLAPLSKVKSETTFTMIIKNNTQLMVCPDTFMLVFGVKLPLNPINIPFESTMVQGDDGVNYLECKAYIDW